MAYDNSRSIQVYCRISETADEKKRLLLLKVVNSSKGTWNPVDAELNGLLLDEVYRSMGISELLRLVTRRKNMDRREVKQDGQTT